MGVTSNKYMQEEQARVNRQKQNGASTGGYNISPVSAEKRAATPKVTQPQVVYTAGKQPQNYSSRYQPVLDSIMEQIQNPEAFKYEFNGDEMFRNYADLYTQYGKQAMLDTMGQASALTGGYGNSYAQNAGQQAYQQYLLPLYDKGVDLRNAAYQSYRDELGDLQNQYSMLQAAEAADYGRYQDALSAWQTQQNLDLAREQWEHQLALEAAAAEGGGGRGGSGGDEETGGSPGKVFPLNGKYYYFKDGKMVQTTEDAAKKANSLDYTLQDAQDMYSGAKNTVGSAVGGVLNKGLNALTSWVTSGSNTKKKDARLERVK